MTVGTLKSRPRPTVYEGHRNLPVLQYSIILMGPDHINRVPSGPTFPTFPTFSKLCPHFIKKIPHFPHF